MIPDCLLHWRKRKQLNASSSASLIESEGNAIVRNRHKFAAFAFYLQKYANAVSVWYQRAPPFSFPLSLSLISTLDSWRPIQCPAQKPWMHNWRGSWQESTYALAIKSAEKKRTEVMNIHNGKHFRWMKAIVCPQTPPPKKNSNNKTQLRPMMNPTHLFIIMTGLR